MDKIYQKMAQPPVWALREIKGGRLKGKTDINPQWRYQAMTENYGPCGIGWKYEVVRLWTEPAIDGQIFAFAQVNLYVKLATDWSEPIPAIGGNMLIQKEMAGLHANDEAYKMAITDALGNAMKMLGVAADIYAGRWDGSKYQNNNKVETKNNLQSEVVLPPKKTDIEWKTEMEKAYDMGILALLWSEFEATNPSGPTIVAVRRAHDLRKTALKASLPDQGEIL